jgi:hypothetical protein
MSAKDQYLSRSRYVAGQPTKSSSFRNSIPSNGFSATQRKSSIISNSIYGQSGAPATFPVTSQSQNITGKTNWSAKYNI